MKVIQVSNAFYHWLLDNKDVHILTFCVNVVGSPIVLDYPDGKSVQVGIVSYGPGGK